MQSLWGCGGRINNMQSYLAQVLPSTKKQPTNHASLDSPDAKPKHVIQAGRGGDGVRRKPKHFFSIGMTQLLLKPQPPLQLHFCASTQSLLYVHNLTNILVSIKTFLIISIQVPVVYLFRTENSFNSGTNERTSERTNMNISYTLT